MHTLQPEAALAQVPAAPSDAIAIVRDEHAIDVTWIDNSTNESAFDVFRSEAGSPFQLAGAVDANLTLFQDRASGIIAGVEYCYEVRARNTAGSSDPSNQACVTVPARPAAPSGLITSRIDNNSPILLTWIDNATNEDGFLVWRDVGDTGNFVLTDSLGPSASRVEDIIVRSPGRYCYFVTAYNVSGESDRTNISCLDVVVDEATLPTTFEVEAVSGTAVDVFWEFGLTTHVVVYIERSVEGNDPWTEIFSTRGSEQQYSDRGLNSDTEYCYRLIAESFSGSMAETAPACTQTEFTTPAAPTNVAAVGNEDRTISITWSQDPSPRLMFRVERRAGLAPFQPLADSVDALEFVDRGLVDNEIYCYRVQSFNPQFESEFSSEDCAIVAPSPVAQLTVDPAPQTETSELFVSWQQGDGTRATSFEVSFRPSGEGDFSSPTVTADLSIRIGDLEDATAYDVQVVSYRAVDSLSSKSQPAFATGSTLMSFWPGDIDGDGTVTVNDVMLLASDDCFGMSTPFATDGLDVGWREIAVDPEGQDQTVLRCDADRNGVVEIFDFLAIAANFERETGAKAGSVQRVPALVESAAQRNRLKQIYESFEPARGNAAQARLKSDLAAVLEEGVSETIPDELRLGSSYPNPARDVAGVPLDIPEEGEVRLSLINASGRLVQMVAHRHYDAGRFDVSLDVRDLPAGIYFLVLETESRTLTRPLVVVH